MIINSTSNPRIKNLVKLKKASERKKQKLFVVEGKREIDIALKSGLVLDTYYFCEEFTNTTGKANPNNLINLSKEVFNKLTNRESPDGHLALFQYKEYKLVEAKLGNNPLLLIVEAIEKPGNLGAITRTADAAGVDGIILNNPSLDIYNPNAIRSSQGTIFSVPIYLANIEETIDFCKKFNIEIIASSPSATKNYLNVDFKKPSALLFGAESDGLSEKWLKLSKNKIKIEMLGKIDSLNLSVSAAIIVFEALRQRKIK